MLREQENKSAFELAVDMAPKIEAPNEAICRCMEFLESHQVCCECFQTMRLTISEAIANALEHGIFRLPSALKEDLFYSKTDWLNERMAESDQGHVTLNLKLMFEDDSPQEISAVKVEVTDSGPGFDWRTYMKNHAMPPAEKIYGRGLAIIKLYASHMSFNEKGNSIQFIIPCRRGSVNSNCPSE
ncbi:MAG: ATP-binding protein [Holophagales bacterium]|jgi:anti-sigma regulatory factor (Ser/Thr protein kinase)|nr:ATP-binding protein [Holophagales bacterium]